MANLKEQVNKVNMENQKQAIEPEFLMKWNKEDRFYFDGVQFGTLVNTLKNITESQTFLDDLMKARTTIGIASANELVQKKLNDCMASGQVRKLTREEFDAEAKAEQEKELPKANTPNTATMAEEVLN